jgi:hypothetical protein
LIFFLWAVPLGELLPKNFILDLINVFCACGEFSSFLGLFPNKFQGFSFLPVLSNNAKTVPKFFGSFGLALLAVTL